MAAPVVKLENCEVCAENKAKYTCPKCEVRTCCITCVNIHKKELECDGIRNKTKYIQKHAFTDLDLLSDYRLLEEVGRSVDKLQRDNSRRFLRGVNLPQYLNALKHEAFKSGIKLVYMTRNFTRSKDNTTYLDWKTRQILWRIEWIFPQAENIKWITKRALQTKRLSDLVESVLDPLNSSSDIGQEDDEESKQKLHQKLQFYRAAGLTGIKVLLKAESVKKSDSRFYDLDLTLSLQENLAKKVIIEFPIMHVVLKDHSNMYEIIDSDEEEEEEVLNAQRPPHRRKRQYKNDHPKKDEKKEKGPVNFFFGNDSSDSEEEKNCSSNIIEKNYSSELNSY